MLNIEGLVKNFGKNEVLKGIDTNFESGRVYSVIGPNGSGKTTLIKCILGMVVPDQGRILFDGEDIQNGFEYRREIGYMPQIGRYPENMKIGDLFGMMKDIRKGHQNALDEELIEEFKLSTMFQKTMRTLSGGTTQKVSACLAFLFNPKSLILDEPTAGLDPLSSEILKEKVLKEKKLGKLILLTSHIMSEVDEMADHMLYLQEGKVLFSKSLTELKTETGEEKLGKAIAKIMREKLYA